MIEKIRDRIRQRLATKKKSAEEWAYKYGLTTTIWAFSIIALIIGFIIFGAFIVAFCIGWDYFLEVSLAELLRLLIYGIGGVGAAVGLRIATQRQKTFSEQVQVQVDQGFNERLGRGVELLAKDNVVMCTAGVSILVNLFNNANEAQKPIVASIIYDFLYNKLYTKHGDDSASYAESLQDVINALYFLIDLPVNEREILLPNRLSDGKLNFSFLDFIFTDFTNKTLEGINFSHATMVNVDFSGATIKDVNFFGTTIEYVDFSGAKIENSEFGREYQILPADIFSNSTPKNKIFNCDFSDAKIRDTTFCNVSIEHTEFSDIEIHNVAFGDVEFLGGRFYCRHDTSISSENDLPCFVGTLFASANFTFSNGFKPDDFFKSCYYVAGELRPANSPHFNTSQSTEFRGGMLVFVESGQPAEEQVAVEVIEWQIEQAKKFGEDVALLENELADAKTALQQAKKHLKKYQNKKKPTPKPKAKKPKAKKPKPKPTPQK